MIGLRSLAKHVARTPLHPQWLLGPRKPPAGLAQASGRVLDIGAADRWIVSHLPVDADYVALDYPSTGRDIYAARPDVFADAAALPFADGRFDTVLCLEVLEHVPYPGTVVAEIYRVLKPGGRAWLSMPFLYPLHDAPYDFQRYTEYGLRRDLQNAGLEVTSLRKSGHAVRTAGLLACLSIAGGVHAMGGMLSWVLSPLAVSMIFLINMLAYGVSLAWPDWEGLSIGHDIEVIKP
jgi:SAM-dependent methyltransferase